MEYYTKDPEVLKQLSEALTSCGCCARCTLRYMGVNDMYTYRGDTQEMRNIVEKLKMPQESSDLENGKENEANCKPDLDTNNDSGLNEGECTEMKDESPKTEDGVKTEPQTHNSDPKSSRTCVVCLGILDQYTEDEFLQKIKADAVGSGFVFSCYMCSLMNPVCMILREHSLMLHLKETFPDIYGFKKYTDISTVKDVWKWRNGPLLKEVLGAPFDMKSTFDITLTFKYADSDKECSFLLSAMPDTFRKRKEDRRCNKKSAFALYNRANVAKAVEKMSDEDFKNHYQCPPQKPSCPTVCDIRCQHEAVFLAGRYNKYSRTLSQTPWLVDGVRKSELSVEELLCTEINKHFKHTEQKFSSSGREDVDVLMLGDGRPFVLELVNPRQREFSAEAIAKMQKDINAATKDIRCRDLQIITREDTEILKQGEIDKVKNYSALCWSAKPLSLEQLKKLEEMKDLTILQKTPVRVLHRRPLSTRDKIIHSMQVEKQDDHHFLLDMSTQAGTYIKEFVHGDFGRTKPNLSTLLGVDCDILQLDVKSVELNWPKKIEET